MCVHFELFGDESVGQTAVVYGIVGVDKKHLLNAERIIREHKKENGIVESFELHCKKLFHYDSRKKTIFKKFSSAQLFSFYKDLLSKLRKNHVHFRVGRVPRIRGKRGLDLWGKFKIPEITDKHLVIFAFISAVGHLFWDPKISTNLYVDRENTKIPWLGGNKQVQSILKEMGGIKQNPSLVRSTEKPLLEIADCLAYSAGKVSAPGSSNKAKFMELIKACDPIRIDFSWNQHVLT